MNKRTSCLLILEFLIVVLPSRAQWVQTKGPCGGSTVFALAINTQGHIFAGAWWNDREGGMYRSTDNGENWTPINAGLTTARPNCLIINRNGDIFAGTMAGVYRSTDNGETWSPSSVGMQRRVFSLAISPTGHIFAGTDYADPVYDGGVYRSTDNGSSWTLVRTGLPETNGGILFVEALAISSDGRIFAGTSYGVFCSRDDGGTWAITPGMTGFRDTGVTELAINSTGHIFASTQDGIFRSTDNGEKWTQTLPEVASYAQAIIVSSSGDILVGDQGVYRSTDNGGTWTRTGSNLPLVYAIASNASGHLYAGTWHSDTEIGGVFRSTDKGSSWTLVGVPTTTVYSLAVNSIGHIFAGTDHNFFRSTNNGATWTLVDRNLFYFDEIAALATNSKGYIFAAGNASVSRSTNDGASWTRIDVGSSSDVKCLAINSSDHIYAGNTYGDLYRSTNDGLSWAQLENTPVSHRTTKDIAALGFTPSGHLLVGTFYGVYSSTAMVEIGWNS